MRMLIALLVVVYLVGVGVVLAPTVKAKWNTGSTSQFVTSIASEIPTALAWPATIYRKTTERG
ncbi:hypothetical protein DES32_0399 [Methylovirgula ligni]|uniref:Uncharacterized protein n=1 Tax=Methylovirgula ligni TaxID=569860 RepID=A0A3D9Z1Y6_9HYPH|nr:hypothetical protein DES32_0399 [Methylovirgula ligni]